MPGTIFNISLTVWNPLLAISSEEITVTLPPTLFIWVSYPLGVITSVLTSSAAKKTLGIFNNIKVTINLYIQPPLVGATTQYWNIVCCSG